MPRVKICGITNLEDALLACDLGAHALGFIFYQKSPRYITPERARVIMHRLPPFLTKVGVFVNDTVSRVTEITRQAGLDLVQLHGEESPDYASELHRPYLKVFRVDDDFEVSRLADYPNAAGFLLDTYRPDAYGGTGETFDWNTAVQAKKHGPIVLSGGLNAHNVAAAIAQVEPYAVDVSSGVEAHPGTKSPEKLRALFHAIQKQKEESCS